MIGINVAYLPPKTGAVEIGFAIPTETVRDVTSKLLKGEQVDHPFLGVRPTELWPEVVDRYDIQARSGALVFDVVRHSPADDAGITAGDVITASDGKKTPTVDAYLAVLRHSKSGVKVRIDVTGLGGDRRTVRATLSDQAKNP